MLEPRRILVVKLATLGALLTATPALRALRTRYPEASIGVLATPATAGALQGLDSVDTVVSFPKHAFDRPRDALVRLPTASRLAHHLRSGGWDTLVLLHHLTTPFGIAKYAALSLASGARVRVGLDNGRGWFLTHAAEDRGFGWRHEVDYSLDVVEVLGARRPACPRLELAIGPDDEAWAEARWRDLSLGGEQQVVMIGPGSGTFSMARRWAPERFVQVGQALRARYGLTPLVLAGVQAEEQPLAMSVAARLGPEARTAPAAPSPQALAALLR